MPASARRGTPRRGRACMRHDAIAPLEPQRLSLRRSGRFVAGDCKGDDRITRVRGVQPSQIGEALVSAPPAGQELPRASHSDSAAGREVRRHPPARYPSHATPILEAVVRQRFLSSRRACSERRRQQTASSPSVTPRRGASPNPASSQSAICNDVGFCLEVVASLRSAC